MNELNIYKIYQLLSFFVMKFSYRTLNVPNMKKDEIWLVNPSHKYYPLIRITVNSIEQVMFEENRIRETIDLVFNRAKIKEGRYLDLHIYKDEILANELFDSVAIEENYYSGIELNDIYPGIHSVVHQVANPDLEIKEILSELNEYSKKSIAQKRQLKVNIPVITGFTIIICVLMYILSYFLGIKYGDINTAIVLGANYKMFTVGLNEFYRVITCGFLHSSVIHLLMNMLSLYTLGNTLEKEIGSLRFALILFGSVIVGSLVSLMFNENIVSLGISGGLYGLFGVYLMIAYKNNSYHNSAFTRILAINLAINFMGGVDFYGHLGGLVAGIIFYYFLSNRKEALLLYAFLVIVLSFKVFTVNKIEPKYAGTDMEVVEVYQDLGLERHATNVRNKLFEVYEKR